MAELTASQRIVGRTNPGMFMTAFMRRARGIHGSLAVAEQARTEPEHPSAASR